MQKQPSKGFFKESVMRNFAEFTRKHLCRNLFFDKVKLCRSSTSLKTSLQRRCFLVNFGKFVRTPFLQNTTGRLLLITAISIVVKGEQTNENLIYHTKTKAYVPIWARRVSYQKKAVLIKSEQVSEAVVRRCSSNQVFLKISQIPQKNTCVGDTL